MRTNPVAALRASGIVTAFAAALLVSHAGAVGATTSYCSTLPQNRITTCFLDLTTAPSSPRTSDTAVVNGAIFRVPVEPGTSGNTEFQRFVRIREPAGGQLQLASTDGKDASIWSGPTRLGDIATVTVCDGGGTTGNHCERFYEFLLDANERANSPGSRISLDKFKVFTDLGNGLEATPRYDLDGGRGGDVSVLTNYSSPSDNGRDNSPDLQVLVPVSNFAGLWDDTFVYLYSTFKWTGTQCRDSSNGDSSCAVPAGLREAAAVPLPATALLLGIGLAGMVRIRRRRSPD